MNSLYLLKNIYLEVKATVCFKNRDYDSECGYLWNYISILIDMFSNLLKMFEWFETFKLLLWESWVAQGTPGRG